MLDKARIRRFHAALSASKLMDYKRDFLAGYGVESTKSLTAAQADELIDRLNQVVEEKNTIAKAEIRKNRSIVMTLLNDLGVYAHSGDWSHVNRFLLKPKIAGKVLYEMSLEELKKLQGKLRKMKREREKKKQEEDFLATNN